MLIISFSTGKYRTEVWNDDVNPMNDWWEAYSQSEEEIEAMAAGYDFNNPEEYFKSKGAHLLTHSLTHSFAHSLVHEGIDYAKAREEYENATNIAWEAYKKERATPFDPNELATVKKYYNELMATKQAGGSVDMDKLVETEINYFRLLKKEKEYLFRLGNN